MDIEIRQDKASIGDTYQIFTSTKRTHSAFTILREGFIVLHLQKFPSDQIILTIEGLIGIFGPKYLIEKGSHTYLFKTVSWYKGHYQCEVGDKMYDIYAHDELKYSVYCNQTMIAFWQGQAIVLLEGDKYKITLNANADKALIIAFCLIIDRYYHNENSTFSFNLGRFFPETKLFDKDWQALG